MNAFLFLLSMHTKQPHIPRCIGAHKKEERKVHADVV